MALKTALLSAITLLCANGAFADDMREKIAAHLKPANAELELSRTGTATTAEGRTVQVVCGIVTVRKDAGNFASRTFAYVIDEDRLWLTEKEEWLKQPQRMGVIQVMKYCPGD